MPHPDYLNSLLTASQLAEWEAFLTIDPFDSFKDDYRFAYLYSQLTNLAIQVHGKKGTQLVPISDYLIQWDIETVKENKKVDSIEKMKQTMLAFAKGQNKAVEKEKTNHVLKNNILKQK